MLTTSPKHNPNYLAKIHKITNLHPHPKADRLQLTMIDGNSVIVGMNTQIGDIGVFFPLECKINAEYLAMNNQFEDKAMNANVEVKGFFNKHGRVRAIKLRDAKSEGYWTTLDTIQLWDPKANISLVEDGMYFDTINGNLFVEKYIPKSKQVSERANKNQPKLKRESILVDGQFRFHDDTSKLGNNMHRLLDGNPKIAITQKLHGTSAVFANILTKKKLSWKDKVAKWFGIEINETRYSGIYSSRKVIKNQYDQPDNGGFYGTDLWARVNHWVGECVEPGISIYGEIVGYVDDGGRPIQSIHGKPFDYGCEHGEHEFYVYRITMTSAAGHVYEFTWDQVLDYCTRYGLFSVPTYFQGTVSQWRGANDYLFECPDDDESYLLEALKTVYLEKTLPNGLPDEGVCVRIEKGLSAEILKLKSFAFLSAESMELDKGEVDIETQESEEENA